MISTGSAFSVMSDSEYCTPWRAPQSKPAIKATIPATLQTMRQMTGIEGQYDPRGFKYQPPAGWRDWETLIRRQGLRFTVTAEQVHVHPLG